MLLRFTPWTGDNYGSDLVKLNEIVAFMDNDTECRRILQLKYFGLTPDLSSIRCNQRSIAVCDNCENCS